MFRGFTSLGGAAYYIYNEDSGVRWSIGLVDTEAGGNTGSNFTIYWYNDDGSYGGVALKILRGSRDLQLYGSALPRYDFTYSLGSGSYRWLKAYLRGLDIDTQDMQIYTSGDHLTFKGLVNSDHLPYIEVRDSGGARAFYLGWGSKSSKRVDWTFENGYYLNISGLGHLTMSTTAVPGSDDVYSLGSESLRWSLLAARYHSSRRADLRSGVRYVRSFDAPPQVTPKYIVCLPSDAPVVSTVMQPLFNWSTPRGTFTCYTVATVQEYAPITFYFRLDDADKVALLVVRGSRNDERVAGGSWSYIKTPFFEITWNRDGDYPHKWTGSYWVNDGHGFTLRWRDTAEAHINSLGFTDAVYTVEGATGGSRRIGVAYVSSLQPYVRYLYAEQRILLDDYPPNVDVVWTGSRWACSLTRPYQGTDVLYDVDDFVVACTAFHRRHLGYCTFVTNVARVDVRSYDRDDLPVYYREHWSPKTALGYVPFPTGKLEAFSVEGGLEGGAARTLPDVSGKLTFVSDSADDSYTIAVVGIDTNGNPVRESVTLRGTTAVTSAQSYSRILGMVFPYNKPAGTVTVTDEAGTTITIPPGTGHLRNYVKLSSQGDAFAHRVVVGSDIPPGTYKAVALLYADGAAADDVVFEVVNETDGTTLATTTITPSTDLTFYELDVNMTSADQGDTVAIRVKKGTTATNSIYVLLIYLFPIRRNSDTPMDYAFPLDVIDGAYTFAVDSDLADILNIAPVRRVLADSLFVEDNIKDTNMFKVISGDRGWLGVAPLFSSNVVAFKKPYRVELDTGSGWTDVTDSYDWSKLTDLTGSEVTISVEGGAENVLRLYYEIGGFSFASAMLLSARWIDEVTRVKVESSSTSDFSSDVNTLLDISPGVNHWDEVTLYRFSDRTRGHSYLRITIGFKRNADGDVRFREVMVLGFADVVNGLVDTWSPLSWDSDGNVTFPRSIRLGGGIGEGSIYNVDIVSGFNDIRFGIGSALYMYMDTSTLRPYTDNSMDLGAPSYRWRNLELAGYANVGSLQIGGTTVINSSRQVQNVTQITVQNPGADTYVDIWSGDDTAWASQIRFIKSSGEIRHIIVDDFNSGRLLLIPGFGGGASKEVRIGGAVLSGGALPSADDAYDLGSSNYRWRNLYLSGTLQMYSNDIIFKADGTGGIVFQNADGTEKARISAGVGAGVNELNIKTAGVVAIRIDGSQRTHIKNVTPYADNTYDLGDNTYRWRRIYTASISTGEAVRDPGELLFRSLYDFDIPLPPDDLLGFAQPYKVEAWDSETSTWVDVTGEYDWSVFHIQDNRYGIDLRGVGWYDSDTGRYYARIRLYYDLGGQWIVPASYLVICSQHIDTFTYIKVEQADDSSITSNAATLFEWNGVRNTGDTVAVAKLSNVVWRRYVRIELHVEGKSDLTIRSVHLIGSPVWGSGSKFMKHWVPLEWGSKKVVKFLNHAYPNTDNSYDLGSSTYRWRNVYAKGTVYLANNTSVKGSTTAEYGGYGLWIQTASGRLHIGPLNTVYCHFVTDRGAFYFNKPVVVNGSLSPYTDVARDLGSSAYRWRYIYVGSGIVAKPAEATSSTTLVSSPEIRLVASVWDSSASTAKDQVFKLYHAPGTVNGGLLVFYFFDTSGTGYQVMVVRRSMTDERILEVYNPSTDKRAVRLFIDGESYERLQIYASGKIGWGDGTASPDTYLYRAGAGILKTDGTFRASRFESNGGAEPYAVLTETGELRLWPEYADSTNTLRDSPPVQLWARYWNGTQSVSRGATIFHRMIDTTPSSEIVFQIGGVDYMTIGDAGIKVSKDVLPTSDNAYSLGSSSYRWANVYAVNVYADSVYATSLVQAGDLLFKNGWRFTEDPRYGIVLVSPEGKRYRLVLQELN